MEFHPAQLEFIGANATDDPDLDLANESRDATGIVISSIVLMLILLLSVFGNLAVILAVLKTPRLREKTSNIFLINLSVTDLMNASLVMPSASVALIADGWYLSSAWCYAQCAFNYWFIIVSMLTLSMISIDGYYAVLHPMHYISIITPRVVKLAVGYAWLQGFVFALVPVFYRWVVYDYWEVVCAIDWDNYGQDGALTYVILAFVLCFLVPAAVMTFCYTKICRVARKKAVGPKIGGMGAPNPKKNRQAINERRVVRSLAIVVAIFFLCMTPFCVTKLIKICINTKALPPYLYLVSSWFGYLASATNPFIYAIFRRDFRRAFQIVFCRRFFPGRSRSHSSHGRSRISISETRQRRPSQLVTGVPRVTDYNGETGNQPSVSGLVSHCVSEARANGGNHGDDHV